MAKNYLDLSGLSSFLNKLKENFSTINHTHTKSEITDYVVDSSFSSTSTNPIQNNVVNNAFLTFAQDIETIEGKLEAVENEFDEHTHNYAGSSSAGGSANSAEKLNTNAGSEIHPVFFADGIPMETTYTLEKSVPSDAVFTDTTYSNATTESDGLMSLVDKTKLDNTNIAYGTCATSASTAAKVVNISGNTNWDLKNGSMITVVFSNTNTANNPTLNVNGTGAKNIYYGASRITTSNLSYAGYKDRPVTFMYDGTQYRFISWGYSASYSNATLGQGYGTCSTDAETTAKTASLSSYTLATGGIVAIKFTNDVPAGATLNVNSKGAKSIYYRGSAIADGIIKAGDVAVFIYSTQYHLISIDRWYLDINDVNVRLDELESTKQDKNLIVSYTNSSKTEVSHSTNEIADAADAGIEVKFFDGLEYLNLLEYSKKEYLAVFYTDYFDSSDILNAKYVVTSGNSVMMADTKKYNVAYKTDLDKKQNVLTGTEGQVVQINASGKAVSADLNLITVEDIDLICGGTIQYAEEVLF